ncbi:MAG: exodeoxyribonuclease VII small subunit [Caldilineales bacterium]|nr:exodeoxyribonuclease VII small subunit [Caldilineales bacterium]
MQPQPISPLVTSAERIAAHRSRKRSGDGNLEASLARYETGVALVRRCNDLLDQAELRLRELSPTGQETDFTGPLDSRS